MKRILLTTLVCLAAIAAMASDSLTVRRAVYFDVDQYQLTAAARRQLDSMVLSLRDQGECSVSIYGSTDIDGGTAYNQKLSERRAKTVQDYLLAHDIKAVKCISHGLGRKGDELTKSENRRVDVELQFTYFTSVAEVFQSLAQDADQKFEIDPQVSNEIKCKNKTVITIPAGALVLADGSKPKGKVNIIVREAISNADILSQDLNSVSDGKMLETGGMVYVNASSDGKPLNIDPASAVGIAVPSDNAKANDMNVFFGGRSGNQAMNWKMNTRRFAPSDNVKTVPMDIDRSTLQSMMIRSAMPAMPSDMAELKAPVAPSKPREPVAMDEPQRANRYNASRMERIFNKAKIARKNEELYQAAMHKYELYQNKVEKYEAKMKDYEKAMTAYNEEKAKFEAEGVRRMQIARQYFRSLYEYTAASTLDNVISKVMKLRVTNKTQLAGLTNNQFIQYQQVDQHQALKKILGAALYQYYHYDVPGTAIRDIDNTITLKKDSIAPTFTVDGYAGIYDSLVRASHIEDTLAALQNSIFACSTELGLVGTKTMTSYIASVNQLGYINCDRFYNTPPDQMVSVKVQETDDVKMYMVFTDIKSCLPLNRSESEFESILVPKGRTVKIVAVKVNDGKPQLAVSEMNTSERKPLVLQYKTCSLIDIKDTFKAL